MVRDWKMIRAGLVRTWKDARSAPVSKARSASVSKVSSDKGMVCTKGAKTPWLQTHDV